LSEQMQSALESRQIIARAEGVVMERKGISAEDAYTVLRHFSQSSNQPLLERAGDIVDSTRKSEGELSPQINDAS
jgi:AmiR/NasT family two-component response regulator